MSPQNKNICVVEYGVGNIGSILNACRRAGAEPTVARSGDELLQSKASHIVLPGVGAVGEALRQLRDSGFEAPLNHLVIENSTPVLGICVGMQLMAETCEEYGSFKGLGWIPGHVSHLSAVSGDLNVPHIGWNTVHVTESGSAFADALDEQHFYFLHSYAMACPKEYILCTTNYGGDFVSAVHRDRVWGMQFHPEKSTQAGIDLLQAFFGID